MKASSFPSHDPVLLAIQMVMFAITLQSPGDDAKPIHLSEPNAVVMRRLVGAVAAWITSKEEMHGTLESLISIMLEGIFELNCGNLRKAWSIYRRAICVAQLMGIHLCPIPPQRRINQELDVDPGVLWFRIIYMDSYLSILLGLPKATSEKAIKAMAFPMDKSPINRFEQQLTIVAIKIMERNEIPFDTCELLDSSCIDTELLHISNCMPIKFWHPISFQGMALGSAESILESLRLGAQVYYFGLVIQLHLPYMMRKVDASQREYSRTACVNASREIISRFISHRTFNPNSACSRPVDFLTFYSAMTILLAHIESHQESVAKSSCTLAHQRRGDLALLELALDRMEAIPGIDLDPATRRGSQVIRKLLYVESEAAAGNIYTSSSVRGDELDNKLDDENEQEVHLTIPHIGLVKLGRKLDEDASCASAACGSSGSMPFASSSIPNPRFAIDEIINWPNMADCFTSSAKYPTDATARCDITGNNTSPGPNSLFTVTDFGECPFQGVDISFLNSLTRGMTPPELPCAEAKI